MDGISSCDAIYVRMYRNAMFINGDKNKDAAEVDLPHTACTACAKTNLCDLAEGKHLLCLP